MTKLQVQTNKHLFTFRKVGDYVLGSDNIARMIIDKNDLKIPNGIYIKTVNGIPHYVGIFSENDKYGKNFGTRHLYTRKDKEVIDNKNGYLVYHQKECDTTQKDKFHPSHPRIITKSLLSNNVVEIFVATRDELMTIVDYDDCINLKSLEDRFIKKLCLLDRWNIALDKTVKKYK